MFNGFNHNHNGYTQPESESLPSDEKMLSSENRVVKSIINFMDEERRDNVLDFTNQLTKQDFSENPDLSNYMHELLDALDDNDREEIKEYSGFRYKWINFIARNPSGWNYYELGPERPGERAKLQQSIKTISSAIRKSPKLPDNIKTFRGTNLDSFRGYGIETLDDLKSLEGQLFYEQAFTSTSLKRENSFAGMEFNGDSDDIFRKACNIEMEILVPSGSNDGVVMDHDTLKYSQKHRDEYLIDRDSLFRIMSVEIDGDFAKLTMALIPKEVWSEVWSE